MKATIVLAILALIVATVQAVALETNAERMARGLPPRAPSKLYRKEPSAVERACLSLLLPPLIICRACPTRDVVP